MSVDDYYSTVVPYYGGADYYDDTVDFYAPTTEPFDLAHGNKQPTDMNFELTVQPGGFINPNKRVQTFVGANTAEAVALEVAAYLGSIDVRVITKGPVPNSIEWLQDFHWTATLDSDGYATAITPVAPVRWPAGALIRFAYNTKPAAVVSLYP